MTNSTELTSRLAGTKYTDETWSELCRRLAEGEPLTQVCREDHMPAASTILAWRAIMQEEEHPGAEQYARARAVGYELLADEILEIADDGTNDWVKRENARTGQTRIELNSEAIQRSRARIDSRKWLLSKMLPKVYGDASATVNIDARDQSQTLVVHAQEAAGTALERLSDPEKRAAMQSNLEIIYGEDDSTDTANLPQPATQDHSPPPSPSEPRENGQSKNGAP